MKLRHLSRTLILGLALSTPALSQSATLVKDINTTPPTTASSNPVFHDSGAITFFSATSDKTGAELYTTIGGNAGVKLIKDIHPGPGNSFPGSFHTASGKTYFAASDGKNGRELWVSDGTPNGTKMVKDIVTGAGSSHPSWIASIGSTIYFVLGDPAGRSINFGAGPEPGELWKSNGTAAGTVLVKKFATGGGNPNLKGGGTVEMFALGKTLFLTADDGKVGRELWKSDGTTAGTVLVKDIYPGSARGVPNASFIQYFTAYNGKLYFYARSGGPSNYELWSSDGTGAGTTMVKDIRAGATGSSPRYLTVFGKHLYFSANDGATGNELWRTDGTANGTVMFKDINQRGTASSSPYNYDPNTRRFAFEVMGNAMYFRANDGLNGNELWKCDGTVKGTVMVKDIRAGNLSSSPFNITFDGNKTLYFAAFGVTGGQELWKSDGTAAGTVMVKDINTSTGTASSSSQYFSPALLGGVVFRANDGKNGIEPWYTDGVTANTRMLKDINNPTGGSGHSSPRFLTDVNGTVFFSANDGKNGQELWKSDGTAAGTVMLKDINPGSLSSSPNYLTAMNGRVYFYARDSGSNYELWKSDGTTKGTTKVKEIFAGATGSFPRYLIAVGDTLYFSARSGSTANYELWKSDGTTNGTVMVKDIFAGTNGSYPNYLTELGGIVYFYARSGGTANYELWRSDGTANGTSQVKDIAPGTRGSYPRWLVSTGKLIYFSANNGTNGYELWKSDGTANGTVMVKDISVGTLSSSPNYFTPVGDKVFFAANDGYLPANGGQELYVSDGTAAGTVRVKDIWPGTTNGRANSSSPYNIYGGRNQFRQFAVLGNEVYFRANDGVGGFNNELWKSDGTAKGTVIVKEINPNGTANPNYITAVGSRHIFFQASDSTPSGGMGSGSELWMTDGTSAGTKRVTDIYPADNNSLPTYLALSGGKLFFYANDGKRGFELWTADPGATSQPIGHACPLVGTTTLAATDPVLGGNITLTGQGKSGSAISALLIGLKNNPTGTSVGAGCHLYVDPLKAPLLLMFKPAANGSWKLAAGIPNDPAHKGIEIMLQAGFGPSATAPFGVDLTGGVKLTLGY